MMEDSEYDPLVVLQPGRTGATPLFCIAGAGASVTGFFELAGELPSDLPVLGLQARGLDGATDPFPSVETAAQVYLDAVREAWPSGPFRLLGHSFGGWVAFELAGLLRAEGDDVEALFLVDSEAPYDRGSVTLETSRVDALEDLVNLYNLLLASELRLTREDFETRDGREQIAVLEQELMRTGVLPRNAPEGVLDGVVAVFEANVRTSYRARRVFDGTLWLVNATESEENVEARISGWRRAARELCCASLPGNHVTMLLGENAAHLGEWIGATLESSSDGARLVKRA